MTAESAVKVERIEKFWLIVFLIFWKREAIVLRARIGCTKHS